MMPSRSRNSFCSFRKNVIVLLDQIMTLLAKQRVEDRRFKAAPTSILKSGEQNMIGYVF